MPIGVEMTVGRGAVVGSPVPHPGRAPVGPPSPRVATPGARAVAPRRRAGRRARQGPIPLRLGPVRWLATALACAAVVVGLGMLGSVGASLWSEGAAGAHVVRARPGENLWELAHRAAPGADTADVVGRIRALNGLDTPSLVPGQPLRVPAARSSG